MKDIMSEEHYCYYIHTSLTENSAYPPIPSIVNSPIWANLPFSQENLDPSLSIIFTKLNPLYIGGHTMESYFKFCSCILLVRRKCFR